MKVLILTNGEYGDYHFAHTTSCYDYIICADNGIKHAMHLNLIPDCIVGDFDSADLKLLKQYESKGTKIHKYPKAKDETDTEIALNEAIKLKADKIDIFGGLGTRFDHTLANVHLLYKALSNNIKARLINSHNIVYLIKDHCKIEGEEGDLVSLLPFTERVTGIDTDGLAYPLNNAVFEIGHPYGVSNYLTHKEAHVAIRSGVLIVIHAID